MSCTVPLKTSVLDTLKRKAAESPSEEVRQPRKRMSEDADPPLPLALETTVLRGDPSTTSDNGKFTQVVSKNHQKNRQR